MPVFDRSWNPLIVGHRGVRRSDVAENTPDAFRAAASEGADWVELDARRTADDQIVVYHNGCTPDGVPIVQRTAAEHAASGIAGLPDVLAALPPGLGVNIEVKNLPGEPDYDPDDGLVPVLARIVKETAATRPLLLSSFNPLTVAALGQHLPGMATGLVHYDAIAVVAAAEIAVEYGAVALASRIGAAGLDSAGIGAAHDAGLAVMVWTVNDTATALQLAEDGADAICTDDPGSLRAALDARRPA